MKVVGFKHRVLKFENGNEVSGYDIYFTEQRDDVTGYATDHVFASDSKLVGYKPTLGDEVIVSYNRWGKFDRIFKEK